MAQTPITEIRELSTEELTGRLRDLKQEALNLVSSRPQVSLRILPAAVSFVARPLVFRQSLLSAANRANQGLLYQTNKQIISP